MAKIRLDAWVRAINNLSWGKARSWIETGKVFVDGKSITDAAWPVEEGQLIELKMNTPKLARGTLNASQVVYTDSQLIVINKPAGLSSVPFENEKDTLDQRVAAYLNQKKVIVVHRLDRDTSGLIVFARTHEAAKGLANQFRFHTVRRKYYAIALGKVRSQTIRSELVENRGDGLRGSRPPGSSISRDGAKLAVTHVSFLQSMGDLSLIECVLETGRTHQIRIHLSEAGHPLLGERAYIREYTGEKKEAPRIMLHAAELGFIHPVKETPVFWSVEPPEDFQAILRVK